jgi:hypothetical protein
MTMKFGVVNFANHVCNPAEFEYAKRLGVMQRIPLEWKANVDADGKFILTWDQTAVQLCAAAGLSVLGVLGGPPADQIAPGGGANGPPVSNRLWVRYIRVMLEQYPEVRHWQVMSEMDHPDSWGTLAASHAVRYVELLRLAYEAIKGFDPDIQVVCGGPAGNWAANYQAYYDQGAKEWFDVAAGHTYTLMSGKATGQKWDDYKKLRILMNTYHDGYVPFWVTETGWRLASANFPGQTLAAQASFLVRNFTQDLPKWGIDRAFLFMLHETTPDNPNYGYGIVDENAVARPAYDELLKIAKGG